MSFGPPGHELPDCPACPICNGKMELVYDRINQQVCVCTDCHSGFRALGRIPTFCAEVAEWQTR